MKPRWKIIARHKWILGATITESYLDDPAVNLRRFTATIRDRIDAGDESVFNENQVFPEEVK